MTKHKPTKVRHSDDCAAVATRKCGQPMLACTCGAGKLYLPAKCKACGHDVPFDHSPCPYCKPAPTERLCESCFGSGIWGGADADSCPRCGGSGIEPEDAPESVKPTSREPLCGGDEINGCAYHCMEPECAQNKTPPVPVEHPVYLCPECRREHYAGEPCPNRAPTQREEAAMLKNIVDKLQAGPAPTGAEVLEARDAFAALIRLNKGNQATSQTFIHHAETILAALAQAQGEVERLRLEGHTAAQRGFEHGEKARDALRAENDKLVQELERERVLATEYYEQRNEYSQKNAAQAEQIKGLKYREWKNAEQVKDCDAALKLQTRIRNEYQKKCEAQAEQIKRLRDVADEAEKFRAIIGPNKFPYALTKAIKEARHE